MFVSYFLGGVESKSKDGAGADADDEMVGSDVEGVNHKSNGNFKIVPPIPLISKIIKTHSNAISTMMMYSSELDF